MLCLERSRLLAHFNVAARDYRDATVCWQSCAESADLSSYREAAAARQSAHIEYEIARLELEKHTGRHGCADSSEKALLLVVNETPPPEPLPQESSNEDSAAE
jgi:hypothetical protein